MTAPDFRTPPSPHSTRPGEPPQMWPLNDPDYYRKDDDRGGVPFFVGVRNALGMLALAAIALTFLVMAVRWVS